MESHALNPHRIWSIVRRNLCTACMWRSLTIQMSHVVWSVRLSLFGTQVKCAKTAELIEIPFVNPRNHVVDGGHDRTSQFDAVRVTRWRCCFLGRLFQEVVLIKLVSNVRTYVCAYVRLSVHKRFLRFQWRISLKCLWRAHDLDLDTAYRRALLIDLYRWVMHDGMQYNLIQCQGQGHEPFNVGSSAIFKSYFLCHL